MTNKSDEIEIEREFTHSNIVRILIWLLGITFLAALIMAWILYDDYKFHKQAFSDLGVIVYSFALADSNVHAGVIFSVGMLFASSLSVIIALFYINSLLTENKNGKKKKSIVLCIFSFIMGIGVFLIGIPKEESGLWTPHNIGVALFGLGFFLFNLCAQISRKRRRSKSNGDRKYTKKDEIVDYVFVGLSGFSLLVYIVFFLIHIAANNNAWNSANAWDIANALSQKIAILICIIATWFLDESDM